MDARERERAEKEREREEVMFQSSYCYRGGVRGMGFFFEGVGFGGEDIFEASWAKLVFPEFMRRRRVRRVGCVITQRTRGCGRERWNYARD